MNIISKLNPLGLTRKLLAHVAEQQEIKIKSETLGIWGEVQKVSVEEGYSLEQAYEKIKDRMMLGMDRRTYELIEYAKQGRLTAP